MSGSTSSSLLNVVAFPYLNVKDFGAVGDGITDDSAAILATVNAAAAVSSGVGVNPSVVFFPPGVYLVTSPCLTPTNTTFLTGLSYVGSGWYTSVLRFGTLCSPTWFYDDGATNRLKHATFCDLGFEGKDWTTISAYTDIPTNANGFKITSSGSDHGFKFFRCRFEGLNKGHEMDGTNTASEMKYFSCRWRKIRNACYTLNNAQAVNHELFGCDVESIYGDVFSIGTSGGGSIKVYGGSVVMLSDVGSDVYFLRSTGSSSGSATPLSFNGVRMEIRGNHTNIAITSNTHRIDAKFNDCLVYNDSTSTTDKTVASIGSYSTLVMKGCSFTESSTGKMLWSVKGTDRVGQAGRIVFDDCVLPTDWSDRCSLTSLHGHISAVGCRGNNVGASLHAKWAHDFDLHWNEATAGLYTGWASSGATLQDGGSLSDTGWRLKIAQIKFPAEYWPRSALEPTLKLPKNAIIKSIHLRKPAGGVDSTVTVMTVGNNDKSVTHLTSNSAPFKTAQTGDISDYYYHVGDTANERTLRLYANPDTTGTVQGGICIVEYY